MASTVPFEFDRPNEYILVWPGEDRESPTWSGDPVPLPSRNEVADPTVPGSPFRYPAAKDASGKPIPGTVVLKDKIGRDEQGSVKREFDAQEWLRGLKSNNEGLFNRGLAIVISTDQVPAAMQAGIPRWRAAQVAGWQAEVRRESERRARFAAMKQIPPVLSPESELALERAVQGLRDANVTGGLSRISDKDLFVAQGGSEDEYDAPAKPVSVPRAHAVEPESDAPDFGVIARGLRAKAKEAGIFLKKELLEGLLDQDPAVIKEVADKLEAEGVSL